MSPILINGNNKEEVIALLNRRIKDPTSDKDRIVGIAIEGGSIRGVVSAAILDALNEFDIEKTIDMSFGTSSGGLNSLYFPNKDMNLARSIYSENAVSKECINVFAYPNMLNVKWLVDSWISDKKRFNQDSIKNSNSIEFFVTATNAETSQTRWFSSKKGSWENFQKGYRASCLQPIVCSDTEVIDENVYIDGFLHAAIPIDKAIELGCTDLIIIRSQSIEYRKKQQKLIVKLFEKLRLRRFSNKLRTDFEHRHLEYNKQVENSLSGFDNKINTIMFTAPKEYLVKSSETDEVKVNYCFNIISKIFKNELSKVFRR